MARTISQSIGQGGYNTSGADIKTIQELLNLVPPAEGGPAPKLAVDGLNHGTNWNHTIQAIHKFQKAKFRGWSDGRVDPEKFGGKTMTELNKYDKPSAPGTTGFVNYTIPGIIPSLVQPNGMACWATVGTMLKSWRAHRSMTIREALTVQNRYYLELFDAGKGLPDTSHENFARAMGFRIEPLKNFTPEAWLVMLQQHGALGVVTAPPFHARVMIGMWGDGSAGMGNQVKLLDPADGRQHMVLFPHFAQQFEAVANSPRAQLWHY
ncbi:MAG: papain-like cysteine protease family protein [Rhodocyclaceae bacterium]|nr:papain-like cysteine protease family protein [Rhodocyclaceae bacterium]